MSWHLQCTWKVQSGEPQVVPRDKRGCCLRPLQYTNGNTDGNTLDSIAMFVANY
jgi:hypothetical protein